MTIDAEKPTEKVSSIGTDISDRAAGTPSDTTQNVLALCGIVVPILFSIVVVVLARLTPNYSHMANTVSELGAQGAPYALYGNVMLIISGILVMAFAVGLHRGIGAGQGSLIGPGLIAFFGLSVMTGVGLTPIDPDPMALINLIHVGLVLLGFFALVAGMYFVSSRLSDDRRWEGYARATRWWSGVLLLLFLVWFIPFLFILEVGESPNGALQRLLLGGALLWIEITAIKLFQIS